MKRMASQIRCLALGALALALVALAGWGWSQPPDNLGGKDAPIRLTVRVPDPGAALLVDGTPTQQTGELRYFESPPFPVSKRGTYVLKITWMDKAGKEKSATRKVRVRGGEERTVDFTKPEKKSGSDTGKRPDSGKKKDTGKKTDTGKKADTGDKTDTGKKDTDAKTDIGKKDTDAKTDTGKKDTGAKTDTGTKKTDTGTKGTDGKIPDGEKGAAAPRAHKQILPPQVRFTVPAERGPRAVPDYRRQLNCRNV